LKKFQLHLDAVIFLALIVLAAIGGNVIQYLRYSSLLQTYIDKEWELASTRDGLKMANNKLKQLGVEPIELESWVEAMAAGTSPPGVQSKE